MDQDTNIFRNSDTFWVSLSPIQKHAICQLKLKHEKWPNLSFSHDRLSLFPAIRHSLQLKIHQQQQQPPDKTFPFLLMAFVFETRDPSGAGCHVSDCPVWERAQPEGLLSREKERGWNHFPAHYPNWQCQLRQTRRGESGEVLNTLKVLLTEWALWYLKRSGPNLVLPPVHCGSAFCTHYKKKREVCHMQDSDGGCLL